MRLGIVGAGGYWGRRILGITTELNGVDVMRCAADANIVRLVEAVGATFSGRRRPSVTLDYLELIRAADIDAVVIASPAELHYSMARDALLNGKHVFLEKPMCLSSSEARELANMAEERQVVLFVDHTYLHSECIGLMRTKVHDGFLGRPLFLHSNRTQIGIYREHGVLWDLAPHDLSIVRFLFPEERIHRMSVTTRTHFSHVGPRGGAPVSDTARYAIVFESGFEASGLLTWCYPRWGRDIAVVGTEGMLLFESNTTVRSFRCRSSRCGLPDRSTWHQEEAYVPEDHPLKNALEAFCRLVEQPDRYVPQHLRPEFAVRVIEMIEAMERSELPGWHNPPC